MSEKRHTPGLIDEPPMMVIPSLAVELGINKAIVFQQLHYLLNRTQQRRTKYNEVDGFWWVYNSYNQWQENYFPWLSISALKKIFTDLEKDGYVISRQGVKSPTDRRKWYRIDYETWESRNSPSDKNCPIQDETKNVPSNGQQMSDVYTETTTEKENNLSVADAPERKLDSDVPVEPTPEPSTPEPKDDKPPTRAGLIVLCIKAWLDAQQAIQPKAYGNKAVRELFGALLDMEITPEDVREFVEHVKAQDFWRDKFVKAEKVGHEICDWKGRKNQTFEDYELATIARWHREAEGLS